MAGANEVFLKQAGTGAAWMGPQSSFDPVLFAREAAFTKIGAEQGKKDEENKAKAAFLNKFKVTPAEVMDIDNRTSQKLRLDAIHDYIQKAMDPSVGWTPQLQAEGEALLSQYQSQDNLEKGQNEQYQKFNTLKTGENVVTEDMDFNGNMWAYPEYYIDKMPEPLKKDYEDIMTSIKDNPIYQGANGEQLLINDTRSMFRTRHQDLLNPVQKPKDIAVLWNGVRDLVTNNIKQVTGSDYNTKTDEYADWDNDVEITLNNGEKKTIKSIKSNAINYYNGSPDAQYSAEYGLSKQPQNVKDQYAKSANPGLDYFLDQVRGYNQDVTTGNVTKTPGGERSISFGGYSTTSDWTPNELSTTIAVTRDKANKVYGEADIDGFTITKEDKELNLDKVVSAPVYYKANDATQNKVPSSATSITLKGVKPFMAPTFKQDITWDSFSKQLEDMPLDKPYKGKNGETINNAYQDFLYKFGKKYGQVVQTGNMGGIILTKKEQKWLKERGLQEFIVGGKFVSGEMSWIEENKRGEQVVRSESSAIIPLSYINSDIKGATNIDFNLALDKYKNKYNGNVTDFEYLKAGQDNTEENTEGGTNTKGSNTDKKNPSVDEAINY